MSMLTEQVGENEEQRQVELMVRQARRYQTGPSVALILALQ